MHFNSHFKEISLAEARNLIDGPCSGAMPPRNYDYDWCSRAHTPAPVPLLAMHNLPPLRGAIPLSQVPMQGPPPLHGVSVTLQNAELWRKFNEAGTEMIITKPGRRMFPGLRVRISGLDPDAQYFVVLELRLASPNRFKYCGGQWMSSGAADSQPGASTRHYTHADAPASGATWLSREVSFHKAKLTNNTLDRSGNIVLTSMHKYLPRIHVIRCSDVLARHCSPTATFSFPETEFIAVTAYQNDRITKMKIDHNPFAKGFRETGMSRCKRKQMSSMKERDGCESPVSSSKDDTESERMSKQMCSDARSVSSHDDSGMSSMGSATPPCSPSVSLPSPSPVTPSTEWTSSAPKCSLSIERLLAKDDLPRRPTFPTFHRPFYPTVSPFTQYYSSWSDSLYMHGVSSAYGHPAYPYLPAYLPPPLVARPSPLFSTHSNIPLPLEPSVVDLSLHPPRHSSQAQVVKEVDC